MGFTGVPSPMAMEYVPDVVTHAGTHAPDWRTVQAVGSEDGAVVLTFCTCGDPNCCWSGGMSPRGMVVQIPTPPKG